MRLPYRLVSCLGLGVAGLIAFALIFPSPLLFSATVRTGWMLALAAGGAGALLGCAGILRSRAMGRRKVAAAMVSVGVVLQFAVSLAAWNDLPATPGLA